ncbi:MAG: hypothetical protein ACRELF_12730, partial [Gemmataceae bacterium]
MKRFLIGGLVALGMTMTFTPAWADTYFDFSCCRHMCLVHTARNRCWSFNSHCKPLPCVGSCGYGGVGPGYAPAAYGVPAPGYGVAAAPVAAAPAAPAAAQPAFRAPQPTPATNKANGLQQA